MRERHLAATIEVESLSRQKQVKILDRIIKEGMEMASIAFQDQIPGNGCYGCGPSNRDGLRIKSYWEGEESICIHRPEPHHSAGPPQFLNGGIIATLIDCHSVCTAIANAYRSENRPIGSAPHIWCVTANLNVTYLRPTPLDAPVTLRARVAEAGPKKTVVRCRLYSGSEECARGEVLAVRVPGSWRETEG
jgi:acyl-coenzyme A thioesterase PaaI-like protein